ncbi:MAG TPA: hypothetical protein VH325_13820 [Bryobacteraceae bacterium]|jgi:hypothetical protein|nr:hypothetical protein [Bryobacteraceae bacterium]
MKKLTLTSILLGVFALSGFAQVNVRKQDQQDRIGNGVQSGKLTAGETRNLEDREAALNGETRADHRKDGGGPLTAAQKARINTQQNGLSSRIYQDKHNANTAKFGNNEVGQRRENQQDRIAQGIRSGNLKAGQTAQLEGREANLNRQVSADRSVNGGRLTNGERAQVNKRQNNLSRSIYRDKR